MSEEVKETTKTPVSADEYEKAKNKFNLDEYSQEEFHGSGKSLFRIF